MALLQELGTDVHEHASEKGTSRFWTLTPSVYVTWATGHMDESHASAFERYGHVRLEQSTGKIYVFHEWLSMTGYDSQTRKQMTAWSLARLHRFEEVHLAVRSKLVAMGVQVANIALRGLMRAHTDRAMLEAELRRVLREVPDAPHAVRAAIATVGQSVFPGNRKG